MASLDDMQTMDAAKREAMAAAGQPTAAPAAPAPAKFAAPNDMTAASAPRKFRDVSTPEILGAGATSEAIETDYWNLTDREYNDRLNSLMEVYDGLDMPAREPVAGAVPGAPMLLDDKRMEAMLLEARQLHPEAFEGKPITRAEIEADVNKSLRAEWDDAQATLAAAPDSFWGRSVPEFIGRMGPAATDEVNGPLTILTAGVGSAATLGRTMLVEAGLSVIGEALTLPDQFEMSERLDIAEPNVPAQLAFAATVGALIPAAFRGAGKLIEGGARVSNRALVATLRQSAKSLTPPQRAALNAVERVVAEEDIGPAAKGSDNWKETDAAVGDIDAGRPPAADAPPSSAERVEALTTPPKAPGSGVTVEYSMGPARPLPPDEPVIGVITAAVEDSLGPGARVVVTSGQEGPDLPQHGSDRHKTGDAADIAIFDKDGNQITMATHPELMREIARNASRRGAKGIGLGEEYMGGAHMHVDLVEPGAGQSNAWGSEGVAMRDELKALEGTGAAPREMEASIRDLIRDTEARGSYDTISDYSVVAPPKPLSQMTLDEVDAWQTENYNAGAESTAAGGYQFMRDTLRSLRERMGLTGSEPFDRDMQDMLAVELMKDAGLEDFKAGKISADKFADGLAGIWAAFPDASGSSVYAGDGLNASLIGRDALMGVIEGGSYVSTGRPAPTMSRVAASGVKVDPKAYQFRTEVDASGVGTPMDRVSQWDELLAGDMILHQRRDGSTYIADGHHRKQLADRLEAGGHPPIMFNAFVLREEDGYTVDHVRAVAAVKNIEAGSATAIDAAKVLRVDPAMLDKLTLRSSQARDARGLMQLSDDGFDMVTNGLIREDQAAAVPSVSRDPAMQNALLRVLVQMKPRSMAEARQILADAHRAGLAKAERDGGGQASLFGDDFLPEETLFKERAEVMSKALAQLKADKKVFATLVRERDRIQEAGNALTDETNTARLSADELALGLVERLVNRAGPLDDALNAAARAVRTGAPVRASVNDFLGFVRGAIEGGGLARLLDGSDGRPRDAATPDGVADEGAGSRGQEGDGGGGPAGGSDADALARNDQLPQWVRDNDKVLTDAIRERNPAVLDKITALHAQDKTAQEVASATGLDADTVRSLRRGLGLPEQGRESGSATGITVPGDAAQRKAFEAWRDKYNQSAADEIVEGFEALLGIPPVTTRDLLEAAQAAPMRGGEAPADAGLFDVGARDQFDMFADTGRVGDGAALDLFGDPSPSAPEVVGQVSAAENALREALARGEDFSIPTGRMIDGAPEVLTLSDVMGELDGDTEFLGVLNVCKG
jgi:hypothetical protein